MTTQHDNPKRWQFGLRSLLLMPVLVGLAVAWGSWPDRTLDRFHQLLSERQVDEARQMMKLADGYAFRDGSEGRGLSFRDDTTRLWVSLDGMMAIEPASTNFYDLTVSRRRCALPWGLDHPTKVTVYRGAIVVE